MAEEKHDIHPTEARHMAPNKDAQHAAADEKQMTLFQAIKLYPKAVGWSVVLSSALIMEGYDLALLGSLYGNPQFNMKYGKQNPVTGKWSVPANWQSALSNGARAGEVIGLVINGFVSERYGYRKTMVGALFFMTAFIFMLFFAPNVQTLVIGEVFCGIPWGMFQTLTTQYASEVSPVQLRPVLTTFVNMHVRKGDREGARAALLRLTSPEKDPDFNPDDTIAMIEHTNEMEKEISSGTRWADLFRGTDLRRTEIVCFTWIAQTICGQNIMGYFAYFMQKAGLPTVQSFNMSLISLALGLVGTALSWIVMQRVGRRTIHLIGSTTLFILLLIVGSCSFAGTKASNWAIGGLLIAFVFMYDLTIGPVTYALVSELCSTRLKAKTIALARALYNISNIVVNVLTNYQLGEQNWAWGAKTAYFWAGTCGCVIIWAWFRLPEPKGRTYGELDMLFEKKVRAKDFARTAVDPYGGHMVAGEAEKA
ncbi:hypothetical protein GRF29_112g780843 [Pseudopithomyces chartarum]|uniref:Major facilitator superfamily (MFS) profile domain-containing protein n=1 Tax=Pseudopithomyces chartarum TaxID=1892770 RepID=A0AAN6RFC5_9PLEO|nr:hypothetical protein GRF29_112g780843 [Pseudopithomyces chartarum]